MILLMVSLWHGMLMLLQTPNPNKNMNFLFAGYVVVWLLIVGYLYSINRRQKRLDREIALLKQMHEEK